MSHFNDPPKKWNAVRITLSPLLYFQLSACWSNLNSFHRQNHSRFILEVAGDTARPSPARTLVQSWPTLFSIRW